uniref:peptidylprolyl isomerase n=1 Tax=uncultured Draconibacterium sp. TaxID=1573823 RepID=UPI0032163ACC
MKKSIFLLIVAITFFCVKVYSQSLPKVEIRTPFGEITAEIDTVKASVTGKNFLKHVEGGTYKDAVFYRVVRMDNQPDNDVKIQVIQGGVFNDDEIDQIAPIVHETTKQTGIKHLNGTISMARMGPGTASTEFFICIEDQPGLDFGGKRNPDGQGFAAFGKVLKGMDVVRAIQALGDDHQILNTVVKINIIKKSDSN